MHVFVTGGTRGIGFGLVKEFLKHGHTVSFTGTSENSVRNASSLLEGSYFGLVCDVRDELVVSKVIERSIETLGSIDIFINNAGVDQPRSDLSDLSADEIRRVIDINVTGSLICTSVILQHFKKQGFGIVYNMEGLGSNNMKIPQTIVYGSSKRLISYFTEACNKELKEYKNVSVGRLQPGMVFTDLLWNGMNEEGKKVALILGNSVEEVTPFLVNKIIKKKRVIKWLTTRKIIFKFMKSLIVKPREQ